MKDRHRQILEYVKEYYQENGYGPTNREICDGVGLRSTSSVSAYIREMERDGLLEKTNYGQPRSLIIPGFNVKNEKGSKVFLQEHYDKELRQKKDKVFVLHGHFSNLVDDTVEVFGVSKDLELLSSRMKRIGKERLAELRKSKLPFDTFDVEESDTMFEAIDSSGNYIRMYITEHNVEKGSERSF